LIVIGYRVLTFNDCEDAAESLRKVKGLDLPLYFHPKVFLAVCILETKAPLHSQHFLLLVFTHLHPSKEVAQEVGK
jgi:hypothetical protein